MTCTVNGDTGVSAVQDGVVQQSDLAANVVGKGPAFSAQKNAGVVFSTVALTDVTFTAELFDTNNAYDGVSVFTVPVSGVYLVEANLITDVFSGGLASAVVRNGSVVARGVAGLGTSGINSSSSVVSLLQLNAGDTLKVQAISTVAANSNTSLAGANHFSAALVRAA